LQKKRGWRGKKREKRRGVRGIQTGNFSEHPKVRTFYHSAVIFLGTNAEKGEGVGKNLPHLITLRAFEGGGGEEGVGRGGRGERESNNNGTPFDKGFVDDF